MGDFAHSGNPHVELLLPDGDRWRLLRDWWFVWVGDDGLRIERTIKAGMETDFGSIPRIYRWRFSPTGKASPAFLAHDELYAEGVERRDICDRVMLEAMEVCKVNWWDRRVMWSAVRLAGRFAYGKRRHERTEDAA
jgi:hypothetical protein